jgi:hypothetical protein
MRFKGFVSALAIAAVLAGVPAAQAQAPSHNQNQGGLTPPSLVAGKYKAPRTAQGHPDLQGIWTNATITPFERPDSAGGSLTLPPAEAAKLEAAELASRAKGLEATDPRLSTEQLPKDCGRGFTGTNCGYNSFWTDPGTTVVRINGQPRTSILVSPANGKLPPLTPQARARMAERMTLVGGPKSFANPETRSLGERCILSFGTSAGPPMLPLLYNNTYQITQTKDEVAILVEMVHDMRIIRLGAKPLPSNVRQWMGDSTARWEGETLVVETRNMRPEQSFRGASANAAFTERLTRVAPDKILYQFTVSDPETFTQPFSGELIMNASKGPIYEYACHEGNYALPGILAGAREDEKNGRIPSSSGEGSPVAGEDAE